MSQERTIVLNTGEKFIAKHVVNWGGGVVNEVNYKVTDSLNSGIPVGSILEIPRTSISYKIAKQPKIK
jgi:hypothetical protein